MLILIGNLSFLCSALTYMHTNTHTHTYTHTHTHICVCGYNVFVLLFNYEFVIPISLFWCNLCLILIGNLSFLFSALIYMHTKLCIYIFVFCCVIMNLWYPFASYGSLDKVIPIYKNIRTYVCVHVIPISSSGVIIFLIFNW